KGIGYVLQKQQPQHHVFVFRRIHIVAQFIRRLPKRIFNAEFSTSVGNAHGFSLSFYFIQSIACRSLRESCPIVPWPVSPSPGTAQVPPGIRLRAFPAPSTRGAEFRSRPSRRDGYSLPRCRAGRIGPDGSPPDFPEKF